MRRPDPSAFETRALKSAGRAIPVALPSSEESERLKKVLLERAAQTPSGHGVPKVWASALAAAAACALLAVQIDPPAPSFEAIAPELQAPAPLRAEASPVPPTQEEVPAASNRSPSLRLERAPLLLGQSFRPVESEAHSDDLGSSFIDPKADGLSRVRALGARAKLRARKKARRTPRDRSQRSIEDGASRLPSPEAGAPSAPSESAIEKPKLSSDGEPSPELSPTPPIPLSAPPPVEHEDAEREKVEPSAAERLFVRAWAALRAGEHDAASELLERCVREEPKGPFAEEALYWRAVALYRAGRLEAAREAAATLVAQFPHTKRRAQLSGSSSLPRRTPPGPNPADSKY